MLNGISPDLTLLNTIYIINIILYFLSTSWTILSSKYNCDCCKKWQKLFIQFHIIFFTIVLALYPFLQVQIQTYVRYIILFSEIVFVSITFLYIRDIIRQTCTCEKSIPISYNTYDLIDIITFLTICLFVIGYYFITALMGPDEM